MAEAVEAEAAEAEAAEAEAAEAGGRRQDRARQAQRVHGVAVTGRATAAKPAVAGREMKEPKVPSHHQHACLHRKLSILGGTKHEQHEKQYQGCH